VAKSTASVRNSSKLFIRTPRLSFGVRKQKKN
jgi:hypothetical protein